MSGSLLFNERIVAVQPSLVRAVGSVGRAAVLQQIHFHTEANHTQTCAGREWVVRTYDELGGEIGLSGEQVRRAVTALEQAGFVESCQPEGYVRTKWYRVANHPALSGSSNRQNRRMESAKSTVRSGENADTSSTEKLRKSKKEPASEEPVDNYEPSAMPDILKGHDRLAKLKETG